MSRAGGRGCLGFERSGGGIRLGGGQRPGAALEHSFCVCPPAMKSCVRGSWKKTAGISSGRICCGCWWSPSISNPSPRSIPRGKRSTTLSLWPWICVTSTRGWNHAIPFLWHPRNTYPPWRLSKLFQHPGTKFKNSCLNIKMQESFFRINKVRWDWLLCFLDGHCGSCRLRMGKAGGSASNLRGVISLDTSGMEWGHGCPRGWGVSIIREPMWPFLI